MSASLVGSEMCIRDSQEQWWSSLTSTLLPFTNAHARASLPSTPTPISHRRRRAVDTPVALRHPVPFALASRNSCNACNYACPSPSRNTTLAMPTQSTPTPPATSTPDAS
eukprot:13587657-Alexandrium_andersonii.AAC.1